VRWITATHLQQWAETIQARTVFPQLVADLIRASAADISGIRFPSGDKGQVRGFDGVLEATGAPPYVPDGQSIWEFGVTADAAAKANSDYEKRTTEVSDEKRRETTFVFTTLQTWDRTKEKLSDWVDAKRKQNQWAGVEYIDGSMVEDWLALCPAVAAFYSRQIIKTMPEIGIRSTDEYWNEFSSRFAPALVEEILLAGRGAQATALVQRLNEGISRIPYAADTPDEVLAFVVAAIRRAEPSIRLFLESKTLIVDTEEAARQLAGRAGFVFLPRAQARNLAGLLAQYGPTVVSAGADEKRNAHELLPRPRTTDMAKALVGMGFPETEALNVARKCGRSLAVLARLRPSGTASKPEWLDSGDALLPALLASGWQSTAAFDQSILCVLGQVDDYEKVEAPLRKLAKLQDPPVDRVEDIWAMRASVDAFLHLGHLIGPVQLKNFADAMTTVFSQVMPEPKAEDLFQPNSNREDAYSSWLRDGMMNTLLHMAVLHEQADFTVRGSSPQEFVNSLVRGLPGLFNDHRLLASLQDQLSLLAEAAPIPFLEALERLLEGDAARIRPIFDEYEVYFSKKAYYYGVLWALEVVAWDPRLLLRASMCLARLAAIDPGGTFSNRPINSLRSIFLSWSPNTSARATQRTGVVSHVVQAVPTIAWQLIEKLLPRSHDNAIPTKKPIFREYEDGQTEALTYGIVWESQGAVVTLALHHAGHDPDRWSTIIGRMSSFPKRSIDEVAQAIDETLEKATKQVQFEIWDDLRKEVLRHQKFSGTNWALPAPELQKLSALVAKYESKDPIDAATWLFDDWMPDVPGLEENDPVSSIELARKAALQEIFQAKGIPGLIDLADRVKLPQHVGVAIQSLALSPDFLLDAFTAAVNYGPPQDTVASILLADGDSRFGREWSNAAKATLEGLRLTPERTSSLLMALVDSRSSWDFVSTFGISVEEAYWRNKHSYSVRGDASELLFAIDKYLSNGRALAAIEVSSRRFDDVPSSTLINLLDAAVVELNSGAGGTMAHHFIGRTFDEIERRDDISPDELAKQEFRYLPLFADGGNVKRKLTLHRRMTEQPQMFIDAVRAVFRSASSEPDSLTKEQEAFASAAYELLEGLKVLPGQEDMEIDAEVLQWWCMEVRRLGAEADRARITDSRIGQLLAHAPLSVRDGAWPHEAVRSVIESLASDDLEHGLEIERFNMRGAFSRAIGEGGEQERRLARQAKAWAEAVPSSPRTAAMLMRISESWNRHAEHQDISAAKDSLKW
jgi:hypothetical protein